MKLPGQAEVSRGEGRIVVRDNGPGLTAEAAEKALRAGYGSRRPYDTLGLFGMGFNIATGKLGQLTDFVTARGEEDLAVQVRIDLLRMQEEHSYRVPAEWVEKSANLRSGTIVAVSTWWPEGNPNSGFIKKVAGYPKPKVREELGRRYATILRERNVRLVVNDEPCVPFEHCVWDRSRFVAHQRHGRIPAVYDVDEVVATQTRCADCHAMVPVGEAQCPACDSGHMRTVEERVRGWIGIQRFDDDSRFGIDLVRNGRAIRVGEKDAFFTFRDEFGEVTYDLADSVYNRFVGEIHLDHVPVDYLKQDFQRSSPEWQRAMSYLRGDSSLQPSKPGADQNRSPVFMLYQGYRKVREPGKRSMYMGRWDETADKPKRVSRALEREYYQKFLDRIPGFYDDSEWWRLVEDADTKPVEEYVECPSCGAQNLTAFAACSVCGEVLRGKDCIAPECKKLIPQGAVTCPHCGASQMPEIADPWACEVCGAANESDTASCSRCGQTRGAHRPGSREDLVARSDIDDELSVDSLSLRLADGSKSAAVPLVGYQTKGLIRAGWKGPRVPLVAFKSDAIEVFVDPTHPVFRTYGLKPQHLIAQEVALYLYEKHRDIVAQHPAAHTAANIAWAVMEQEWTEILEDTCENISADIRDLFETIKSRLASGANEMAADLYGELTEDQARSIITNMLAEGRDIGELKALRESREFIEYLDEATVVALFMRHPEMFFDGTVWDVSYQEAQDIDPTVLVDWRKTVKAKYATCLEDCATYVTYSPTEMPFLKKARASCDFLNTKLLQ